MHNVIVRLPTQNLFVFKSLFTFQIMTYYLINLYSTVDQVKHNKQPNCLCLINRKYLFENINVVHIRMHAHSDNEIVLLFD